LSWNSFLPLRAHGYFLLAVIVFAEAIGVPVPAALAFSRRSGVCLARDESVDGSAGWRELHGYRRHDHVFVGRVSGWNLLGFLCRVSMNPRLILRSAESFYSAARRRCSLPSCAGAHTMARRCGQHEDAAWKFLRYDFGGALFYILAYGGLVSSLATL